MICIRRADRRVLAWSYLAITAQFYFTYTDWLVMFYLFFPLYMFLLIPIRIIIVDVMFANLSEALKKGSILIVYHEVTRVEDYGIKGFKSGIAKVF